MSVFTLRDPAFLSASAGGGAYDPDAQAYIDRLTGTYSGAELDAINQFFVDLKADGIFSSISALWIDALKNAVDGQLNIISTNYTSAYTNMTHTPMQGAQGNGTTSFIDSGLNLNSSGLNQNNVAMGAYIRTNANISNHADWGYQSGSNNFITMFVRDGGLLYSRFVQSGTGYQTVSNANSQGFYVQSRTSSGSYAVYKNGVLMTTHNISSTNFSSLNVFFGAVNNAGTAQQFSAKEYALRFIGQGLDTAQNASLFLRIESLLDAFGAGVV